jgi:hypothetical protein
LAERRREERWVERRGVKVGWERRGEKTVKEKEII